MVSVRVSRSNSPVAAMLRLPEGLRSGIETVHAQQLRRSRAEPEEWSAIHRLGDTAQLERVVRQRRSEIRAPFALAVIAIRAWIGEHIDAAAPNLERERIGMTMRGHRQKPERPVIAATPDLWRARRSRRHPAPRPRRSFRRIPKQ